jgi:hypothetical protein
VTRSPFEVADELRGFTEPDGMRARKAFETGLAVARRGADCAAGAILSLISVGADLLGCAEPNANAAFALAGDLCRTEDAHEAFVLQSEYLKAQLAALQASANDLGAAIQNSVIRAPN